MAKEYGVTYPVVRKAEKLARLGLNLPPRPRPSPWKIPEEEWPNILRQRDQGLSLNQTGRSYGVSGKVINRVVRAARERLQVPEPPYLPSYPGNITPCEWETILTRIDQGEAYDVIACDYGCLPKRSGEWRRSRVKRWERRNVHAIDIGASSCLNGHLLWPASIRRFATATGQGIWSVSFHDQTGESDRSPRATIISLFGTVVCRERRFQRHYP